MENNEFHVVYYRHIDAWADHTNNTFWKLSKDNNDNELLVAEFYDYDCEMATGRVGILSSDEKTVTVDTNTI